MTDQLHKIAKDSTPQNVSIPNNYAGLIMWAIGKWGIGVVFALFLIPVYQDLKESNRRLADISQANVQVLTALAQKVEQTSQQIQRLDDSVRRIENEKP